MRPFTPIALAVAAAASMLVVASPAVAATSDTASWCALVIKMNTQYGTMKNKHYVSPTTAAGQRASIVVIKAASGAAIRAKVLAVTPSEIKQAQADQLDFFTRLVAHHFAQSTPLGRFSPADATKLMDFQHAHCGITGP